ncbi:MAG: glycosyltransferase N-terminal domain-containing protein [Dakarella massiliensis]
MKGYRLLTRAAVPAAMGYLLYRSRRQPAYRNFWGERFGFSEYPPPRGCPRVWVHAVSVGETNAAKPLIAECLKRWPSRFLLTHMTRQAEMPGSALWRWHLTVFPSVICLTTHRARWKLFSARQNPPLVL